jgi:hypothetical protein
MGEMRDFGAIFDHDRMRGAKFVQPLRNRLRRRDDAIGAEDQPALHSVDYAPIVHLAVKIGRAVGKARRADHAIEVAEQRMVDDEQVG